jgi:hypothetical protein
LRAWLTGPRRFPLPTMTLAALEGLAADLERQSVALDVDRPLLVVMFMGGTGVGKSTLLNALAGSAVAEASFTRPTTRDPVVYYHRSIKPERLDPALRQCRLVPHDRRELEQKVLVDTPDLDSNDLSNRDKLVHLLPIADIVLYVGSQEKYHDRLGWDLFLQHRRRRAFAFVLNKWDRCVREGAQGLRPDDDLLRDLQAQGFLNPLLFRTCAQLWVDRSNHDPGDGARAPEVPRAEPVPPTGEQFAELVRWLEMGLTRLEIEAIKARGVSQLLDHLQQALRSACPPDLTEPAARIRPAWERLLSEEARAATDVLLNTLEPYRREIEHHFALEVQRRFRGLMATYLNIFTKARHAGSSLRERIPLLPRAAQKIDAPAGWDLSAFTGSVSRAAGEQHLDARIKALANRMLLEANAHGFPIALLTDAVEGATQADWKQRYAQVLVEVLDQVGKQLANPTGTRRLVQRGIVFLANTLPLLTLFAVLVLKLWQYTMQGMTPAMGDILVPVMVVFIVLVLLHIVTVVFLPMHWPVLRAEFQRQLERRLRAELENAYAPLPAEVAETLRRERREVEALQAQTREVAAWLDEREHAAQVAGLYGES